MAPGAGLLAEGRPLAGAADGVAGQYGDLARDDKRPAAEREAAKLLVAAEAHLGEEDAAAALETAQAAQAAFRAIGHEAGAADALRIVAHVLVYQAKSSQALDLVTAELARIRETSQKVGEGQMLLSMAEINLEGRGAKGRAASLACATEAASSFRKQGKQRMEANAMLVLAHAQMRDQEDPKQGAIDALATATSARKLFREFADKRAEASALHVIAMAHVRCLALGAAADGLPGGWPAAAAEAVRLLEEIKHRKMEAFERVCVAQWLTGDNPRKALRAAEEGLVFCREVDSAFEATALDAIARAHLGIKDVSKAWMHKEAIEAIEKVKSGVAHFRAKGDKSGEGQGLCTLALAHAAKGEVLPALHAAEEAAKVFRDLGDKANESAILQMASGLYLRQDKLDKALKAAKQVSALSSTLQERAVALETIHEVHIRNRDFVKARNTASELLALCEEEGDKRREAMARLMISSSHFAEGDLSEAVAVAREAQAILNDLGAVKEEAQALRVVAEAHVASEELEAALRAADKARRLLQAEGDPEEEVTLMFLVAQIRLMLVTAKAKAPADKAVVAEGIVKAMRAAEDAAAFATRLGNEQLAGAALCVLAQVLMTNLQVEAAQKATDEAMAIFRGLDDQQNQACVMCIQADIQLVHGNNTKALQLADRALKIYQDTGDARGEWVAMGIREHIVGPPEEEAVPQQLENSGGTGEWTAEDWAIYEGWEQEPSLAFQQPLALAKARRQVDLGAKLNMAALTPAVVQDKLASIVMMIVDLEEDEKLELDLPLMQVGVTSKTAVALRNALSDELPGLALPATMVFDYPSINSMTEMILEGVGVGSAG